MALSHKCLNFGYLYRPANTWYELEAKATLFFYKITADATLRKNYKYLVCITGYAQSYL